jgi:hypothetical protein
MEETDVCHLIPDVRAFQQTIPNGCPAQALPPSERLTIGLHALAGTQSITGLAEERQVSRKFVYQQAATAQAALDDAFTTPATADDQVLFSLPVTKKWLRQVTLGLLLNCHSSYRGVQEFCRDLLDTHVSLGSVHNIVHAAIDQARPYNLGQDLAPVANAGLDEIYQHGQPVLVGADIASTYCFLLSLEDHADADTWAIRLFEARDHGLAPQAFVADFGAGIRAGQQLAFPEVPCRGDVFHALAELTAAATFLEKRAYDALETHHKLQHKKAKLQRQGRRDQAVLVHSLACRAAQAAPKAAEAVALADDIDVLTRWLRYDVFAVSGLPYAERCALYDFILAELQARAPLYPSQLEPLSTLLRNHRTHLLAYAAQLDQDLAAVAAEFAVPLSVVREVLDLHAGNERQPKRWQKEAALRQQLRQRFYPLQKAVHHLADRTVRASSIIENINSRLRSYFFMRREIGSEYLVLLQFFLNHRRFLRSERAERVGKSPAELLTGQSHPHWLEMLGYTRFAQN